MAEIREPAATRLPAPAKPDAGDRPRMPAAFARALAGAALLVGTAVTLVIVVLAVGAR
jgi:hypothetical protein